MEMGNQIIKLLQHLNLISDTETLYTMATQEIVGQYGKTYTWEIKSKLMGLMGREAAAAIVKALDIPMLPEEYMSSSQKILARLFSSSINMLPGVVNFSPFSNFLRQH